MIVFYALLFFTVRGLYVTIKQNNGKMRCKGLFGRILDHYFISFYGDRVCRICGLVQKRRPAGMLLEEGDAWFDKGYAENKNELVKHYRDKIQRRRDQHKESEQRHQDSILRTKVKTPEEP